MIVLITLIDKSELSLHFDSDSIDDISPRVGEYLRSHGLTWDDVEKLTELL